MIDREKIINGLEKCKRCECDDCAEKGASQAPWDCPVYDDLVDSAIALLKEQEPKQVVGIADSIEGMEVGYCPSVSYTHLTLPTICSV